MKVALDAQLAIGTATGIGEYIEGLANALGRCGIEVARLVEPRIDPWRFDRRVYWDQVLLPQRARASGADLLHCAAGTMPLTLGMPVVATVHDVAWLRVQAHARPYARYYFGAFSLDRYRHAQRIVVDSEFSRGELLDAAPRLDASRMTVVYPGVADDYMRSVRRAGDGRTILAVGTIERRKNLELLVRALVHLPDARVVAVGPLTEYADEVLALARELGVAGRLEMRGYVERSEVLDLYASAAVVAVPSRYEGFGYAAAQALCAGTPAIVSDQSSLPEVVRDDAPVVPLEVDAWIAALGGALRGDLDARAADARARSIQRFAWSANAEAMRAVYADALS